MDIYTKDAITNKLTKKQDTLVSGTNIKTINGNSLLGSGNVTISGGGSGSSVASADYATANTQLNGLSINGTSYKLLDVKVNDETSLIIGANRALASGSNSAIAIGDCDGATASGSYSTASGYSSNASGSYSNASGFYSTASGSYSTASGSYSNASGDYSTAIGNNSQASGKVSIALGYGSEVYIPNWVSFDGQSDTYVRTLALKSTDNIFFRNENVASKKTTQASYISGKTLTEVLSGKQDTLVRINIFNITDSTTTITNNRLVFVGYYKEIQVVLESLGMSLEFLEQHWKTIMTGENATQVWSGLCNFLTLGICFGCFYTVSNDIEPQETVSAILKSNYLGYVILNGTTPEGHIVFDSETALKTAFANSSMVLND